MQPLLTTSLPYHAFAPVTPDDLAISYHTRAHLEGTQLKLLVKTSTTGL